MSEPVARCKHDRVVGTGCPDCAEDDVLRRRLYEQQAAQPQWLRELNAIPGLERDINDGAGDYDDRF